MSENGRKPEQPVGVPQTVFGLKKRAYGRCGGDGCEHARGDARIAAVVKPTFAVITNIGVLSHMNTRQENILAEKTSYRRLSPEDGILFVNGDDDLLPALKDSAGTRWKLLASALSVHWRLPG